MSNYRRYGSSTFQIIELNWSKKVVIACRSNHNKLSPNESYLWRIVERWNTANFVGNIIEKACFNDDNDRLWFVSRCPIYTTRLDQYLSECSPTPCCVHHCNSKWLIYLCRGIDEASFLSLICRTVLNRVVLQNEAWNHSFCSLNHVLIKICSRRYRPTWSFHLMHRFKESFLRRKETSLLTLQICFMMLDGIGFRAACNKTWQLKNIFFVLVPHYRFKIMIAIIMWHCKSVWPSVGMSK